jgi:hypothetical protein
MLLVSFALDREGITDASRDVRGKSALREMLRKWNRHGVLVCRDQQELNAIVQEMSPALKQRWIKAVQASGQHKGFWVRFLSDAWHPLDALKTPDDIEGTSQHIALACVSTGKALDLGVPEDEASRTIHGLEICRMDCADNANRFVEADELGQRVIKDGELGSAVWDQRFKAFAQQCRRVVLVDRYAGAALCAKGKRSGLPFLLEQLDGAPAVRDIKIFTGVSAIAGAPPTEEVATRLRACVAGLWSRAAGPRVQVVVTPDRYFKTISHGRYLRFDHVRCVLDTGVDDIFGGDQVWRDCEFSVKDDLNYREIEQDLERASGSRTHRLT